MERLQQEVPWYRDWFDENYLLLYQHRDNDDAKEQVDLIIDTLNPTKNSLILDLGCGEGRYACFFKSLGYWVLGLDLSATLIRRGKEKYPHLNLVVGDMRAIPTAPGKFDLILSLFTSFGYFEEDKENEKVLASVCRSLKPGGVFWLDFLNANNIENNLVPENTSHITPFFQVVEKRKIAGRRIIKDIYLRNREQRTIKRYKESIRLFTKSELEMMMEQTGFLPEGCFGNYRGEEWAEESERTIIFGRKRG